MASTLTILFRPWPFGLVGHVSEWRESSQVGEVMSSASEAAGVTRGKIEKEVYINFMAAATSLEIVF